MGLPFVEKKGQPRINQNYLQCLRQSFFNLSIIFVKKPKKILKNGIVTTSNHNVYSCLANTHPKHTKENIWKKG